MDTTDTAQAAEAVVGGDAGHLARLFAMSPDLLAVWETGARYQMYHALAMALAAIAGTRWPPMLFLGGIVLFCGSLYALALTGIGWLGAVTPIGGVLFIAGWIWLAISAFRKD